MEDLQDGKASMDVPMTEVCISNQAPETDSLQEVAQNPLICLVCLVCCGSSWRSVYGRRGSRMLSVRHLKRKLGRLVMDVGNFFSPDVMSEQRHVMLRHVANRDIARRMGDGQKEDMNRLYKKVSRQW